VAITVRPARRPAASSARPRLAFSPLTVSGVASGRARASRPRLAFRVAFARGPGASGEAARIDSIGVASTTLPPYWPMASEIAPMLRCVPLPSSQ
jgi:hypothetical protein